MSATAQMGRGSKGSAVLSFGFRPFFLSAAIWAVCIMILWLVMLSGHEPLPIALDPTAWHAHEFLFGYLGAVLGGFLLTAVPNWTGRLPVVGWPLAGLWLLWAIGRIAISGGAGWPPEMVAIADLSFPIALAAVVLREIICGENWRNLIVLAMLSIFITGNAVFHFEAAQGASAGTGYGLRLGVAAAVMMIAVVGGRIIPSFTRNWMVKQGIPRLPVPPMQRFDKISLLILFAALAAWSLMPENSWAGVTLIVVGMAHFWRLLRWRGWQARTEPLVWILHLGYFFVPLGAVLNGIAMVTQDMFLAASVQHTWMAGGLGGMTLAVMTRAILGHTGRALHAGPGTVTIYLSLLASVALRLLAGIMPDAAHLLYAASGASWVAAFAGFVVIYGPLMIRPLVVNK